MPAVGSNCDETRFGENLQMLRYLWLSHPRSLDEHGHRRLPPLMEQLEQATAIRFTNGVEYGVGAGHARILYIPHEECYCTDATFIVTVGHTTVWSVVEVEAEGSKADARSIAA